LEQDEARVVPNAPNVVQVSPGMDQDAGRCGPGRDGVGKAERRWGACRAGRCKSCANVAPSASGIYPMAWP